MSNNDLPKMKFDIATIIMPEMAKAAGMSDADYRSVYNFEEFENMLERIMRIIRASPIETRLKIGQLVWHCHSGDGGVVKDIDLNRNDGRFYLVEFTVDFGVKREDWYLGSALKDTN